MRRASLDSSLWPLLLLAGVVVTASCGCAAQGIGSAPGGVSRDAVLYDPSSLTPAVLERVVGEGEARVLLQVRGGAMASVEKRAAEAVRAAGLRLGYWIEVARSPELAAAHPEWMASLQGHPEWRRLFPTAATPAENEVVKCWPWVPIGYDESFDVHLARVMELLDALPAADEVYLNDLQAAPSACGCGNDLCRWTTDYGPIHTATPLQDDAAARFVNAVRRLRPSVHVIPVWLPECEEHDGAAEGACAGVGCFKGTCWRRWSSQLEPLAEPGGPIAVLLLYKELKRDLPIYGAPAGWVREGLRSFEAMPPVRDGRAVDVSRLIAVLQGWDVTPEELEAERQRAREAGASGIVIARDRIAQDWEPRVARVPGSPAEPSRP